MHALSVVVEGRRDAELLRSLLSKDDLDGLRFFAAQGRISLSSVARNILIHEGCPVLVIMDADTLNAEVAEENRRLVKAVISHISAEVPIDVFSFVPEIEVVFFEAPAFLARKLGRELEPEERLQGLAAPKTTFSALLDQAGLSSASLQGHIDENEALELRRGVQLSALIAMRRDLEAKVRELSYVEAGRTRR